MGHVVVPVNPVKTRQNRQIGVGRRPFYGVKIQEAGTWRPDPELDGATGEGPQEGRDKSPDRSPLRPSTPSLDRGSGPPT